MPITCLTGWYNNFKGLFFLRFFTLPLYGCNLILLFSLIMPKRAFSLCSPMVFTQLVFSKTCYSRWKQSVFEYFSEL